jgi:signal transduction histidine kinase/CheY-like chemotaxis protein
MASLEILTSCARTHGDPLLYVYLSGEVVGANKPLLSLFGVLEIEKISSLEFWLKPQGVELSFLLSQPGEYRAKIAIHEKKYDVSVRTHAILLDSQPVIAVVLRDTSMLERARAAEQYFERFKKKLLTNISHEFRTPMNAVIGYIDLLRSGALSSWQSEYVEMASSSALSMMRNIENLLELMQVEGGGIHAAIHPFYPYDLFEGFSVSMNELANAKKIEWNVLIDPRLPRIMLGDQDKIITILRNLVQNAIKFTPESGEVLLEIIVVKNEANEVEVEYAINDNGVGIESSRLGTILRPFASAWENQHNGKDGIGVGLSLSHKYIDMMDSHLMLASEVGRGSRFSFRLHHHIEEASDIQCADSLKTAFYSHNAKGVHSVVVRRYLEMIGWHVSLLDSLINHQLETCDVLFLEIAHLSRVQVDSLKKTYPHLQIIPVLEHGEYDAIQLGVSALLSSPIVPSTLFRVLQALDKTCTTSAFGAIEPMDKSPKIVPSAPKEVKILVAEDNLINLRLLETILVQNHYGVVAVDNGQKAVDAYLKEDFDIVLMDIDMPVMDGLTANRLIKEIDRHEGRGFTPVIALTAHALIGDRERIIGAGLDAHLAKPIDKNFLLQTIERYLKAANTK